MLSLTRNQAKTILENPQALPMNMTKRRWKALKDFVASHEEWAIDFQPESLGSRAWEDFGKRLERTYNRLSEKNK
jgi:transposase